MAFPVCRLERLQAQELFHQTVRLETLSDAMLPVCPRRLESDHVMEA